MNNSSMNENPSNIAKEAAEAMLNSWADERRLPKHQRAEFIREGLTYSLPFFTRATAASEERVRELSEANEKWAATDADNRRCILGWIETNNRTKAERDQLRRDLAAAKEEVGERESRAYDKGAEDARKGVQDVFVRPDDDDDFADVDGMIPVLRVEFYEDSGDKSVGLAGWAGWILARDQAGTHLATLREDKRVKTDLIATQARLLEKVLILVPDENLFELGEDPHPPSALSEEIREAIDAATATQEDANTHE